MQTIDLNEASSPGKAPPGSGRRQIRLLFLVVALVSLLALGGICYAVLQTAPAWDGFARVDTDLTSLVDQYMLAMQAGDGDRAVEFFTDPGPGLLEMVQENADGVNRSLYAGYQEAEITGSRVDLRGDQGDGDISGIIHYEDGAEGFFYASVIYANGHWSITSIHVFAPPGVVEKYLIANMQGELCP